MRATTKHAFRTETIITCAASPKTKTEVRTKHTSKNCFCFVFNLIVFLDSLTSYFCYTIWPIPQVPHHMVEPRLCQKSEANLARNCGASEQHIRAGSPQRNFRHESLAQLLTDWCQISTANSAKELRHKSKIVCARNPSQFHFAISASLNDV